MSHGRLMVEAREGAPWQPIAEETRRILELQHEISEVELRTLDCGTGIVIPAQILYRRFEGVESSNLGQRVRVELEVRVVGAQSFEVAGGASDQGAGSRPNKRTSSSRNLASALETILQSTPGAKGKSITVWLNWLSEHGSGGVFGEVVALAVAVQRLRDSGWDIEHVDFLSAR